MLPAEIGRSHALTRKPDTDHAVVGKEVFRTAFQERFAARNFCFGGILYVRSLSPYGTAPPCGVRRAHRNRHRSQSVRVLRPLGPWRRHHRVQHAPARPDLPPPRHEVGHLLRPGLRRAADVPRHEERYVRPQLLGSGVIGLAGIFDKCIKNRPVSIAVGSVFATLLRLACHFVSGWIIWEALWPNELGWASPLWSLAYNASYMIPEMIITTVAAVALYFPLKKYYYGEDLK